MNNFRALKTAAASFALALVMVPGAAFAEGLSDNMGTTTAAIITDVNAGAVLILGIVGALVAAKVIFGLFRKAG